MFAGLFVVAQPSAPVAQAATFPLKVYVGYVDDVRPQTRRYPTPWEGDPNVIYEGCSPTPSCTLDAPAIMLFNPTASPVTVDSVLASFDTCIFDIWPHGVSLPAKGEIVMTQTQSGAGN